MTMPTKTETHTLIDGNVTTELGSIAQTVFGHLARMSSSVITHYHSDLYWDAMWLHDRLPGKTEYTFFWQVHDQGTYIGEDVHYVAFTTNRAYRFDIKLVDGKATLDITPVNWHGEETS
jgi:hypothetical protein